MAVLAKPRQQPWFFPTLPRQPWAREAGGHRLPWACRQCLVGHLSSARAVVLELPFSLL